ncbi:hypothetical protein P3383_05860 [Vibrio parahaemolyticus]|uniref:hypothetical protein n=1 Tax=Vibrio parahaemolyticus TaxID=670 RepID=UPI001D73773C|nr:hypothetical protein [Vibrio parahaemolyticus]EGR1583979.1 hypothetical protein [Vibrio parahaemolyticus]EHK5157430.1 hypothetical protein [Vibrio parahaemolyticus]EHZ7318756.1 hypothetical protein [Vibrio parahaemolyticus]EIA4664279.1 hypothetical protein [Vibrio parahaemolyticus]EIM5974698.1 hypothetical protein [Vibrio parahaemolyticus]
MGSVDYKLRAKVVDKIGDLIGYHELDFKIFDTSIEYGHDAANGYGYMSEALFVDIVARHYVENRNYITFSG